tara:strand:+ start:235 stop:603 length:369 start_codon:yes stop_codon:yes gene_type:complete
MEVYNERELKRYQEHGFCRINLPDLNLGLDEKRVIPLEGLEGAAYVWRNNGSHYRHKTPSAIVIANEKAVGISRSGETAKCNVPRRSLRVDGGVSGIEVKLRKIVTGSGPESFIGKYEINLV